MRAPFDDEGPNEELRDAMHRDGDSEVRETESEGDVKFGQWLTEAARDYNRPPARAPREEMWTAIAASIAASRPSSELPVSPLSTSALRRSTRVWQMAAAAVLLLGSGIVIGTRLQRPTAPGSSVAATAPINAPVGAAPNAVLPGETQSAQPHDASGVPRGQAALTPRASARDDASYALATVDHLARAEALLTSFKGSRSDSTDASLERWAQDLLADTRLLLDSPAAQDSRRRHLLEDLELVLAQIVQLRAESSADKSLVRKSIERGEVLTRIRTTIPAGSASGV